MHFMLIRDKGELYPIGEYMPITEDEGDDIPEGAFKWKYLRVEHAVFPALFDPTGHKLCDAHETQAYIDFMSEGFDHESSPIQSMAMFDEQTYINQEDAGVDNPESTTLVCARYFEDEAYFIELNVIEDLMVFMDKHSAGINYELGGAYEGGVWGDKSKIAYIVIDSILTYMTDITDMSDDEE